MLRLLKVGLVLYSVCLRVLHCLFRMVVQANIFLSSRYSPFPVERYLVVAIGGGGW